VIPLVALLLFLLLLLLLLCFKFQVSGISG